MRRDLPEGVELHLVLSLADLKPREPPQPVLRHVRRVDAGGSLLQPDLLRNMPVMLARGMKPSPEQTLQIVILSIDPDHEPHGSPSKEAFEHKTPALWG